MATIENPDDPEMKKLISKYKVKPVPDSLMKNYLSDVRKKIEIEKSQGQGFGFPVWMGAVVLMYSLAFAFAFGTYWVEGRPDFSNPVIAVPETEMIPVPSSTTMIKQAERPEAVDIKIESDAELGAILAIFGEDMSFLDEREISMDVERFDQFEIQGMSLA